MKLSKRISSTTPRPDSIFLALSVFGIPKELGYSPSIPLYMGQGYKVKHIAKN
jgi:hypothetical protein